MDRSRYEAMLPEAAVEDAKVLMIGVGGLNSYVGSGLARLGVGRYELVDDDTVEEANVGTQDFVHRDVGYSKVYAMHRRIRSINEDAVVNFLEGRIPEVETCDDFDIMITGPDNIPARQASYDRWVEVSGQEVDGPVYIDHRMGATSYELHVLTDPFSPTARRYGEILREDSGYAAELCGARAIAFTGMHAGARVGAVVAAVLKARYEGTEIIQGEAAEALSWPPQGLPYRGRWAGE